MTTTSFSVADLQSQWHKLPDLDRARAVYEIKQSGVSTRQIALQLHLSESLLRHLLSALLAPREDRFLASQGKISTNELVRRHKAAGIRRSTGKFPKDAAPLDMTTEEIIQRCRPPEAAINEFSSIAYFGAWLVRWTYYAFTDPSVRDSAIDLAMEEQFKM